MFILNKISNVITECHNLDVVEACRRDAKRYAVGKTKEEILEGAPQEPQNEPEESEGKELHTEEGKEANEGTQEEREGIADAMNEPESDPLNEVGDPTLEELNKKTVNDLRKIAKEKGIQGYANMNKDTLVAMIMNH